LISIGSLYRRRRIALGIVVSLILLWQSKILFFYEIVQAYGDEECYWRLDVPFTTRMYMSVIDLSLNLALPCLGILILNTLISIAVFMRTRKKMIENYKISRVEMKCIMSLMGVCVLYISATSPSVILWSYYNYETMMHYDDTDYDMLFRIAKFCDALMVFNFSFNFIIYNASMKFYRQTLISWFCCHVIKIHKRTTTQISSVSRNWWEILNNTLWLLTDALTSLFYSFLTGSCV
jgi:hypothetical protein